MTVTNGRVRARIAGGLVAAAVACAVVVVGASATTAPGVLNHARVTLTDDAISIPKDQFVRKDGITRYPRGAEIQFVIVNKGSVPISLRIRLVGKSNLQINGHKLSPTASAGKAIRPGATRRWLLNFYFRGHFEMDSLIHGKIAVRKPIVIF